MTQRTAETIRPSLGLFDTVMVVISLIIGIGIFRAPAEVARLSARPEYFFLCWGIGGFAALLGGLVFAEIGGRKPMAGGFYKIVSESWGPSISFMMNWMNVLSTCASAAIVAITGSEYLQPLLPPGLLHGHYGILIISCTVLTVIFGINMLGIKMGAAFQNVISGLKILMILLFSALALFSGYDVPVTGCLVPLNGGPVNAVGAGLVSVFFAFGGYQHTINLGNDVRNPRRNMPLGILTGVIIVFVLYLLINVCYYQTLGMEGMANSKLVASDTAQLIFGPLGGKLVKLAIFISAFGYLNATMIQSPRIYYAMAEDKVLPRMFMQVNQRTQVQAVGLIFFTTLSLLFVFTKGSFGKIVNYIIFNDSLILAVVASTIFSLRGSKKGGEYNGFRSPLYPLLPALYIIFLLIAAWYSIANMESIWDMIISIALIVIGYPMYKLIRRLRL